MDTENDLNSQAADSSESAAMTDTVDAGLSAPESLVTDSGAEPAEPPSLTDMVTAAMDKATKGKTTEDTGKPDGQAPADPDGDSTQEADSSSDGASGDSDSTPNVNTPPENWPDERRDDFNKLPADGRKLLLNIYGDMERGLHDSFQKLASHRKELESRFGLSVDELQSLSNRVREFRNEPTKVLSELAKEAGIDIFFNQQADAIPEFENQEQMVKWIRDDAQQQARQIAMDQYKSQREEQTRLDTRQRLEQEFRQCHEQHPDIVNHRDAIIQAIGQYNLPVEQAYQLATWNGMTELVGNAQKLEQERDKAQSELERYRKTITQPPGQSEGYTGKANSHGGDMFENAWERAQMGRR